MVIFRFFTYNIEEADRVTFLREKEESGGFTSNIPVAIYFEFVNRLVARVHFSRRWEKFKAKEEEELCLLATSHSNSLNPHPHSPRGRSIYLSVCPPVLLFVFLASECFYR